MARLVATSILTLLIAGLIWLLEARHNAGAQDQHTQAKQLLRQIVAASCRPDDPIATPDLAAVIPGLETIRADTQTAQGRALRSLHEWRTADGAVVTASKFFPRGALVRMQVRFTDAEGRPQIAVNVSPNCVLTDGRKITFGADGIPATIITLNQDLQPKADVSSEPLNPPVPIAKEQGNGTVVAHIDSGVNYLLGDIARRLARDEKGALIGRDFWDLDDRPFDYDSGRNPFYPQRHGTTTASILLREAPDIRLAPYRYPRPEMGRFADLIAHIASADIRVVSMAMGSNRREDWEAFEQAARANENLLFIVSAGNNGRDIDRQGVYPASLDIDNMIVVSSSDSFGRLARGSNFGAEHVDIITPGEQIPVIDHRGVETRASGSSYAVPRIAALAARLIAKNPDWTMAELKQAIIDRARPSRFLKPTDIRYGWIPNPADD